MVNQVVTESPEAKRKIIIGTIVFVLGQISPLILIPFVVSLDLSSGWTTALSGILMFGFPELAILASIAIMGKDGFEFIKKKIFGFIKKHGPSDEVNPMRYRIGLIMFIIPLLIGWILPYLTNLIPFYEEHKVIFNICGDATLVISLFVLGGDFWDKIRSLFIQSSKIVF